MGYANNKIFFSDNMINKIINKFDRLINVKKLHLNLPGFKKTLIKLIELTYITFKTYNKYFAKEIYQILF